MFQIQHGKLACAQLFWSSKARDAKASLGSDKSTPPNNPIFPTTRKKFIVMNTHGAAADARNYQFSKVLEDTDPYKYLLDPKLHSCQALKSQLNAEHPHPEQCTNSEVKDVRLVFQAMRLQVARRRQRPASSSVKAFVRYSTVSLTCTGASQERREKSMAWPDLAHQAANLFSSALPFYTRTLMLTRRERQDA